MRKRRHSKDYWIGKLVVEVAIAATALESGDEELAYMGLSECLDEYLSGHPDPEIVEYLNEMRSEKYNLIPVSIQYRDEHILTSSDIARRM